MNRPDIYQSPDLTLAYMPERGYTIRTGIMFNVSQKQATDAPIAPPSAPPIDNIPKGGNIAYWGENNLFPQEILELAGKDPFIMPLIDKQIRILYAAGIEFVALDYDDDGNEKLIRSSKLVPDLAKARQLAMQAGINRYAQATLLDYFYFKNIFPELIRSRDGKTIANIHRLRAAECRWSLRKKGEVVSKKCFVNANWDNGGTEDNSIPLAVLDPDNYPLETLEENPGLKKFVFPIRYPDPIRHYYTLAPWDVYRTSQWSEFVQKIPQFKVAMMNNRMVVSWDIKINSMYWEWRFKEQWQKAQTDSALRQKLMDEVYDSLDELVAGASKAGKAIFTHVMHHNGNDIDMIQIKRLDDKVQSGALQEDSTEASQFAIFSFGFPPTLVGHAPGSAKSGIGAGSGSDERVAFNNYRSTSQIDVDNILAPVNFICRFNGLDERIEARFRWDRFETLNVSKDPQQMAS